MSTDIVSMQQDDKLRELMDAAAEELSDLQAMALPYFISGQHYGQVHKNLTALGIEVSKRTVKEWQSNPIIRRYVANGKSLMRQWVTANMMQLAVQSIGVLRDALASPVTTQKERNSREENARFILRYLGRLTPREMQDTIDTPTLAVAATSAAIIGDKIASVLREGGGTSEERDVVIGEYKVIEREDMSCKSRFDNVKPEYGKIHVDFEVEGIQCHICGRFYRDLSRHLSQDHDGVLTEEYRQAYGLADDVPLKWRRVVHQYDSSRNVGWRGKVLQEIDEEGNLKPYDQTLDEMADDGF